MKTCCPYHEDGGFADLRCVNPYADKADKADAEQIAAAENEGLNPAIHCSESVTIEEPKHPTAGGFINPFFKTKDADNAYREDR